MNKYVCKCNVYTYPCIFCSLRQINKCILSSWSWSSHRHAEASACSPRKKCCFWWPAWHGIFACNFFIPLMKKDACGYASLVISFWLFTSIIYYIIKPWRIGEEQTILFYMNISGSPTTKQTHKSAQAQPVNTTHTHTRDEKGERNKSPDFSWLILIWWEDSLNMNLQN